MFLLLDNVGGEIRLILHREGVWKEKILGDIPVEEILSALDYFLRSAKVILSDLRGVAVRVGEGGFTTTRALVTIANTLAFALDIKASAWPKGDNREDALVCLTSDQPGKYALPVYSAEPRIGGK